MWENTENLASRGALAKLPKITDAVEIYFPQGFHAADR